MYKRAQSRLSPATTQEHGPVWQPAIRPLQRHRPRPQAPPRSSCTAGSCLSNLRAAEDYAGLPFTSTKRQTHPHATGLCRRECLAPNGGWHEELPGLSSLRAPCPIMYGSLPGKQKREQVSKPQSKQATKQTHIIHEVFFC